ncbi:hypothetical protein [Rhizobium oryzicola]|uniref:Lipoprotein n=1 Tax=Rhizobium oryzicola TaxID=1232668 RepID=A0ABT8SZ65_9HYPH|nr:hypothetical protein [Rhizobium oryzicola]MDO1583708.1 hypothetical protein [Rhizobium oryzicola]
MRTALVLMTILGCDDSATDCSYIATLQQRWQTIEQCNAVSEKELGRFVNVSYPVVIAVCQDPSITEAKAPEAPHSVPLLQATTPAEKRAEEQSLARQAIDKVQSILPTSEGMKNLVRKPVTMVQDGYAWVVKRLR